MSNEEFAEIFRPKNPGQLTGSQQIKEARVLLNKASSGKLCQKVLFSGPSGVGKTTIARMYIGEILPDFENSMDFVFVNCGRDTGVDNIRSLVIEKLHYSPFDSPYKVFFLDEIHKLSKQARDALLTEIEPPPSHVVIVACTTQPDILEPPFRSRFQECKLFSPTIVEFKELARKIVGNKKANIKFKNIPTEADINDIISISGGNVRTFVTYLERFSEGLSVGNILELENNQLKLGHEIVNNHPDLRKWITLLEKGTDYYGESSKLCAYAGMVVKNPTSSSIAFHRAMLIIDEFGDGLPQSNNYEAPFIKRINSLYERISKNGS